jgi:predicted XRE-type DNA-binding protein
MGDRIEIEESSGNIWADLGYADAEERMAKALLSRWIDKRIEALGLTQVQAAERMGVSQPDVSNLRRGRVSGFSLERLVRLINALGHNVRISVEPEPAEREEGHLFVAAG